MRFESPHLLVFVPVSIILMIAFWSFVVFRKRRLLARFAGAKMVKKLTRGVSRGRQYSKFAMLTFVIALVFFALARPQYGTHERTLRNRGVEVVLAIDCSLSMLGRDIAPNRFERAREQLRSLIQQLTGHQLAIIAFAGIPIVQCPMTADHGMALNLLSALDVDTVPVGGTAIGSTIRKALDTFQEAGKGTRVLVLLTDGEDHKTDPIGAAREAAEQGVIIIPVGIGSPAGVPIPMPGGGYKESKTGKVNTRLDFETLAEIAKVTGGKAILANPKGNLEVEEITRIIDSLTSENLQTTSQIVHHERFQYFLYLAVGLLMLEIIIGDRSRKEEQQRMGLFD